MAQVCKKLSLLEREAVRLFGGGVNTISLYVSGKIRSAVALVRLLRVQGRHPELFDEVTAG